MEAIHFLKNKGITKATCYTDRGTYYVSELAKLMEEYAALRQPLVSGSLLNDCVYYNLSDRAMCPNKNVCVNCQKQ